MEGHVGGRDASGKYSSGRVVTTGRILFSIFLHVRFSNRLVLRGEGEVYKRRKRRGTSKRRGGRKRGDGWTVMVYY